MLGLYPLSTNPISALPLLVVAPPPPPVKLIVGGDPVPRKKREVPMFNGDPLPKKKHEIEFPAELLLTNRERRKLFEPKPVVQPVVDKQVSPFNPRIVLRQPVQRSFRAAKLEINKLLIRPNAKLVEAPAKQKPVKQAPAGEPIIWNNLDDDETAVLLLLH